MPQRKHYYRLTVLAEFYNIDPLALYSIYAGWYGHTDPEAIMGLYQATNGELLLVESEAIELVNEYNGRVTTPSELN